MNFEDRLNIAREVLLRFIKEQTAAGKPIGHAQRVLNNLQTTLDLEIFEKAITDNYDGTPEKLVKAINKAEKNFREKRQPIFGTHGHHKGPLTIGRAANNQPMDVIRPAIQTVQDMGYQTGTGDKSLIYASAGAHLGPTKNQQWMGDFMHQGGTGALTNDPLPPNATSADLVKRWLPQLEAQAKLNQAALDNPIEQLTRAAIQDDLGQDYTKVAPGDRTKFRNLAKSQGLAADQVSTGFIETLKSGDPAKEVRNYARQKGIKIPKAFFGLDGMRNSAGFISTQMSNLFAGGFLGGAAFEPLMNPDFPTMTNPQRVASTVRSAVVGAITSPLGLIPGAAVAGSALLAGSSSGSTKDVENVKYGDERDRGFLNRMFPQIDALEKKWGLDGMRN